MVDAVESHGSPFAEILEGSNISRTGSQRTGATENAKPAD
jgi:hypothetical protein